MQIYLLTRRLAPIVLKLNLPVKPGTKWEGEGLFDFGDLATINAPMERVSYRLVEPTGNIGAIVRLSIMRNGKEQNVEVEKSFVTIGTMHVNIKKGVRKVLFDIDKGIVIADEACPVFSVVYELPVELLF
ncbi:MAG: hypothetical protein ACYTEL_12005 [Planctomycetota bacterium]